MKSAVVLAAVALFSASVGDVAAADTPALSPQDVAVLTVVLSDFSKSKHSAQYNPEGYIGIAPTTRTLLATWTDKDYLKYQPKLSPAAPGSAVVNYVSRNRQSYRVGDFPRLGNAVHVDRSERELGMLPLDLKGEFRTYAYLQAPGYSSDGLWAYVKFDYLWSIHGAFATYLLKRVDGGWVVIATDFGYAV